MVQPITTQIGVKRFPNIKRTEIKRKISANRNAEKYEQKRVELFICRTINVKKSLSRIDSSKPRQKIAKSKMDNYALVIDISSDEENHRYSTPIKTLPVNMVGRLNLRDFSVEVWQGS